MAVIDLGDVRLNYALEGPETAPAVVFSNSLGTDLRLWDPLMPYMPGGLRVLRYDTRGHGQSPATPSPYKMGALVRDVERLILRLGLKDVVFVGLSIGGLIGQGLAAKRPDLLKGLVLSNTAVKIGTPELWQARMAQATREGLAPLAEASMERWFSRDFRGGPNLAAWRRMFLGTSVEGYKGCCAAIAGSDFIATTSALRMPVLSIAGTEDASTPPDVVREMSALIPGAKFTLIRGAGHLPHVEKPKDYAVALTGFLRQVGHL